MDRSLALVAALLAALAVSRAADAETLATTDEDRLWVHRNLGAAYFDNGAFPEALRELTRAAELAPESEPDARNAGLAAMRAGEPAAARTLLEAARGLNAEVPGTAFALALLARRQGHVAEARAELARCVELGGEGPELDYARGILAVRAGDLEEAGIAFAAVVTRGADHAPRHHAPALYRYGRTLLQIGDREAGRAALAAYEKLLEEGGVGAHASEEELERGPLAALATFERPENLRAAGPLPAFQTGPLPLTGELRWAEGADLDGDGDTDLLAGNGQTLRDLRWDGKRWVDVTASRGLAGLLGVTAARVLDLDNDGQGDLVRAGGGGVHVHRGAQAAWEPPHRVWGSTVTAFSPVDFDHEGDVDLVCVGSSGVILLQNLGDASFQEVTAVSGLDAVGPAVAVVPGDFDDDGDVDLAFVTRRGEVILAANLRGGRFQTRGAISALPEGVFDLAAGDLDGDGTLDLAAAAPEGIFVAGNDGGLLFRAAESGPALPGAAAWPAAGARSLWLADLDDDGRLDLLASQRSGASLGINRGGLRFLEAPEAVRALADAEVRPVAVLLLDGDGRMDLVTSRAEAAAALNVGRTGRSIVVLPRGTKSNRDGVGCVLELLAGAQYVRADSHGGPVHFGLGSAERIDALRILWPNGIRQSVLAPEPGARLVVEETEGLVGSCPFLYTWDGASFRYVTDILTVTPLGLPMGPGVYVPADRDETIRVSGADLRPDTTGHLVAQVTEELREVTYLDQVRLYAVDHPEGTEVQPNEKFTFPPFPKFGVHLLDGARPPLRATDHQGQDVTETLLFVDDLVVGGLPLTRYQGVTEPHTLVLDFGQVPPEAPLTLHLAGWLHWTNASVNVALAQDPRHEFLPPRLEVRAADGSWRKGPDPGFPGGKTKSIPVDLTSAFPSGRAELRITTTLRLYWDRALLQVGPSRAEPRLTEALPDDAVLRFRGHSVPVLSPDGETPERFDYAVLRPGSVPWDQHDGLYTRYGDVTRLVQNADDMYVVMASGDECTLRWRADRFPALEPDQVRTWLVAFVGWAKDGDPNTAHSATVEPWPFQRMSGYPYGPLESYPDDPEHQAYLSEWNTRPAVRLTRDLAVGGAPDER